MLNLLTNLAYTPDGGLADPNHPVYIILWVLAQLGVM